MKSGGVLLVIIGLLALWLAVTGRMDCFSQFIKCLASGPFAEGGGGSTWGDGDTPTDPLSEFEAGWEAGFPWMKKN